MTWRFGAGWFRHRLWRVQRRLLRRTTNQCCRVAMRAGMRHVRLPQRTSIRAKLATLATAANSIPRISA